MARKKLSNQFVLCISNEGYPTSLDVRKVYRAISDDVAEKRAFIRVIDESGDDYLFPKKMFVPVELPQSATRVFAPATVG